MLGALLRRRLLTAGSTTRATTTRATTTRGYASVPAYAYDPIAKAPSKKYPPKALGKVAASAKLSSGLQVSSVDDQQSPISTLSLVLPAGTRHQSGVQQAGVAQWMQAYGFKSTNHRSTIAITREAEIMGHLLSTSLDREHLYLTVDFRRDDLPDVVDLLADVLDGYVRRDAEPWGIYTREFVRKSHEWKVAVAQVQSKTAAAHAQDPASLVLDNLHRVAFRAGLGNPLFPTVADIDIGQVMGFAEKQLQPAQTALIGYGVNHEDLLQAAQHYLGNFTGSGSPSNAPSTTKYYGGEHFEEAVAGDGVHYALAFRGASLQSGDYASALVLRELLGSSAAPAVQYGTTHRLLGGSSSKKDAQVSAFSNAYSDAGLFGFYAKGQDSASVQSALQHAVQQLKAVAGGNIPSATDAPNLVQSAKLAVQRSLLDDGHDRLSKIQQIQQSLAAGDKFVSAQALESVTEAQLSAFAGKLLQSKPSVSALGDVYGLPHADQLGFQ